MVITLGDLYARNQSVYAGKTLEEQKKILIEQAKQESLEELYGTLILTSTDLKNGKITNDEIKIRAVGSVRVKGDSKFYNGQNLSEICANVTSYITKEDLEKYTPKEVKLKDICFSDISVAIKEVENKARESAYKEMLVQFKSALKTLSKEEAEKIYDKRYIPNQRCLDNYYFNDLQDNHQSS